MYSVAQGNADPAYAVLETRILLGHLRLWETPVDRRQILTRNEPLCAVESSHEVTALLDKRGSCLVRNRPS